MSHLSNQIDNKATEPAVQPLRSTRQLNDQDDYAERPDGTMWRAPPQRTETASSAPTNSSDNNNNEAGRKKLSSCSVAYQILQAEKTENESRSENQSRPPPENPDTRYRRQFPTPAQVSYDRMSHEGEDKSAREKEILSLTAREEDPVSPVPTDHTYRFFNLPGSTEDTSPVEKNEAPSEESDSRYHREFPEPDHESYDPISYAAEDTIAYNKEILSLTAREEDPVSLDHTEFSHKPSDQSGSISQEGTVDSNEPSNQNQSLALTSCNTQDFVASRIEEGLHSGNLSSSGDMGDPATLNNLGLAPPSSEDCGLNSCNTQEYGDSRIEEGSSVGNFSSSGGVQDPATLNNLGLAPIGSQDCVPEDDNPSSTAISVQTDAPVATSNSNVRTDEQNVPPSQQEPDFQDPSRTSNPAVLLDDDDNGDDNNNDNNNDNSNDNAVLALGVLVEEIDRSQIQEETRLATTIEFENEVIKVEGARVRTRKFRIILWICSVVTVFLVVAGIVLGVVFGLVVNQGEGGVANDACPGAEGPLRDSAVLGSTVGTQPNETAWVCDGLSRNGNYGVWYWLEGDENYVIADTCSNETNFDTQISVFEGSSCEQLQCVVANDDFCGEQSTVSWRSRTGTNYYILVHGQNDTQGDFALGINRLSRFEVVAGEIFREFGVQVNTPDQTTPQYRAAKWLEGESDTLVELPPESPVARLEFRQRFALAVFYYTTRGRVWEDQLKFLSPESVCSWNGDDEQGVSCDESGVVRSLKFGRYLVSGAACSSCYSQLVLRAFEN